MLLMIDNYDSFTYNLVQYLGELGQEVRVFRNDEISLEEIESLAPDFLMISPGPCTPDQAGISIAAIKKFAGKLPILGVCLGHQSIGQAFGGRIIHAKQLMHGKVSPVMHEGQSVFAGLPSPVNCTRYHSLVIMGVRHRTLPIEGVQFHPESILTEHGHAMLANFLRTPASRPQQEHVEA